MQVCALFKNVLLFNGHNKDVKTVCRHSAVILQILPPKEPTVKKKTSGFIHPKDPPWSILSSKTEVSESKPELTAFSPPKYTLNKPIRPIFRVAECL